VNGFFSPWITEGFTFAPFGNVGGANATAAPGHLLTILAERLAFTRGFDAGVVDATAGGCCAGPLLLAPSVERIDLVLNASPMAPEPMSRLVGLPPEGFVAAGVAPAAATGLPEGRIA
jgi:hypothetical protein